MNIFGGVENKFLPGIHLEATTFESFVEHFSLKWPFFMTPAVLGKSFLTILMNCTFFNYRLSDGQTFEREDAHNSSESPKTFE